ncbi:tripartite tricarboxylate transporter permease [Crossiella cryophila]|uniref:Putative tricarboxylic transport membrane protein n=1 Tax=Crossiella cryophila TaxID=43355 RepID=A0A7W7FSJ1_9PSEU|nr:tripartite tricarboxylate transporter permease [Crossiella cryophila]MBB4675458.1 putative tricarboxylic transport membrane protein [Crossiella cryophila]
MSALIQGFESALALENLLFALLGVLLGTLVGVLPGIGPAMTVALLLPITYLVPPAGALIMFAGIYYGGMYGGSTTSILLNTPGESASIITALEGNKMARAGRGAQALATAAIGSFVAGTIGTLLLSLLAPQIAEWAIKLTSADYFALTVLAFCTVSAMLGASPLRGVGSLALGLFLGLIGTESLTGQSRFDFGVDELSRGVPVVVAAVGLFAVGEALYVASRMRHGVPEVIPVNKVWWLPKEDLKRSWWPWLRGTAIGFPIGAVPAGGADVTTFLSYAVEKKLAKRPEEFGKGAIEGVAGPEAANNAAAAGVLVPLLTLGLPTSATAAIMLAAFTSYNIQPGPLLFETEPVLVWTLIASLYVGNVMLLVLNLPLAGLWVKILRVPRPYLYAGILLCASLGAYAASSAWQGLIVLAGIGLLGFVMRRYGWPVAPAVLGLILGPVAETNLRKALQISQGDVGALVHTPFSIVVLGAAVLAVGLPLVLRARAALKNRSSPAESPSRY